MCGRESRQLNINIGHFSHRLILTIILIHEKIQIKQLKEVYVFIKNYNHIIVKYCFIASAPISPISPISPSARYHNEIVEIPNISFLVYDETADDDLFRERILMRVLNQHQHKNLKTIEQKKQLVQHIFNNEKYKNIIDKLIQPIPEGDYVASKIFSFFSREIIQHNLNAKHLPNKNEKITNNFIYQTNNKEIQIMFTCEGVADINDLEIGVDFFFIQTIGSTNFYLFKTNVLEKYLVFERKYPPNSNTWFFTTNRLHFKTMELYVLNFVRLFYYEQTGNVTFTDDKIVTFLYLMAIVAWKNNKNSSTDSSTDSSTGSEILNREAKEKDLALSFFNGGIVMELIQKTNIENHQSSPDGVTINRLYNKVVSSGFNFPTLTVKMSL